MPWIIILLFFVLLSAPATAQNGTVVITVTGIEARRGGDIAAALFTEENFPKIGKQFKGSRAAVMSSSLELIIAGVPPGEYGIAVFQDIDRNKQLNTNFLGIPQEPIGFSNDARIRFGPPLFKDARITVSNDKKTFVTLVLR